MGNAVTSAAVNKPAYAPGLEGVIAGETAICYVDPESHLLYRGYDIHEVSTRAEFEEVAYLLIHGEIPTSPQKAHFHQKLSELAELPQPVLAMLKLLPSDANTVDVLRTGVSMLAAFDPELNDNSHDANVRKSIRLIAHMSALTTGSWRVMQGLEPLRVDARLSFASRFLYALWGRVPEDWEEQAINVIFNLYAEHDYAASTFSALVTVSTLSDMYAGITSALGTLKGPLHGGANEAALAVLKGVGDPAKADEYVRDCLARHEKLMGFGHRVYRTGDSRVPVMRELVRSLGRRLGQEKWVAICEALEVSMEKRKNLFANLDLYVAPALLMLGVPLELNTPIFACARVSGWCAHIIEQLDHNRLIRPRSIYVGPPRRPWTDI